MIETMNGNYTLLTYPTYAGSMTSRACQASEKHDFTAMHVERTP